MSTPSKRKKAKHRIPSLEGKIYTIPPWLIKPPRNLGSVDITQKVKFREEVLAAADKNRAAYERAASLHTRISLEVRAIYPSGHELVKVLARSAPTPPPDLSKLYDKFNLKWAAARQEETRLQNKREADRAYRARKKAEREAARRDPLLLPARCRTTIRECDRKERIEEARECERAGLPQTWLFDPIPILIQPSQGVPLVDVRTGQLSMFNMASEPAWMR